MRFDLDPLRIGEPDAAPSHAHLRRVCYTKARSRTSTEFWIALRVLKPLLHTIGNLTLLTPSANNSLRNNPFLTKVEKIEGYSLLALNKYFARREMWDENSIDERGRVLFEDAVQLWPFPSA
jgi:hypothetical protein